MKKRKFYRLVLQNERGTLRAYDVSGLQFYAHPRSNSARRRLICNPCIHLREPMNLSGAAEESPLERSIREAIAPVIGA